MEERCLRVLLMTHTTEPPSPFRRTGADGLASSEHGLLQMHHERDTQQVALAGAGKLTCHRTDGVMQGDTIYVPSFKLLLR